MGISGRIAKWLLATALVAPACGGDSSASGAGASEGFGTITVFAASSLTAAFTDLGDVLESQNPGTEVTFNFASSSDLALQITEAAPADVFASADPVQMEVVEDEGLAETTDELATNRLVVLVPNDNPAGLEEAADVAEPGVKLVLAAPEVPAGNYARRAFEAMEILEEAEANVVSNEDDVKAVVTKVALGEADAGVTYVTDATEELEGEVEGIEFPPEGDIVATYLIATIAGSPNSEGAQAFFDMALSEEGQAVLSGYGFGPP